MPSSAKYDDWMGISRCVAATSALTVSRPSAGGQSMTMCGYSPAERLDLVLQPEVRVELADQPRFELGERDARRRDRTGSVERRRHDDRRRARSAGSAIASNDAPGDGAQVEERDTAVGLRVEVDEQRLAPRIASAAARLTAVVVLPTPPF